MISNFPRAAVAATGDDSGIGRASVARRRRAVMLVVCMCAVGRCGMAPTPAPARATESLVSRVDAAIDRALTEKRIVGAVVLVARDGRVVYHRAAGLADRETARPMREDAVFRLASMTKPIVSAAALVLVEQGKLGLDDPVTRWLPDFRPRLDDGREPTIAVRQLLTHTAGLSYGFLETQNGPYHRARVSDGLDQPGRSATDNLRRIASVSLAYPPGSAWRYSVATDVLGEVVARAGGKPLPEVVATLVTGPLGMNDTAFTVRDASRLAVPYADGAAGPVRMGETQLVPFGSGEGFRYSPGRVFDPASFPSGGAGMVGTASDFLVFLEALRTGGGAVLKPDTTRSMTTSQTGTLTGVADGPGWGFGFGMAVLTDPATARSPHSVGTFKWGGAYGHNWFVDPVRRLTVVILTNTAVEGMSGRFPTEVRDALYSGQP
ncbi:MAG: serine hydrolase [Isosphaeraceae bacterium]|nr:serine hydrolase [Isosphaeraceae bacterium]